MRILYFADIRFPLERANGIQTFETCHALASRGHQVTLAVRPDTEVPPRDPFRFYGLPPHPALAIVRGPAAGRGLARRLGYLAFATGRSVRAHAVDVILTRDLGVADALLRLPGIVRPPLVYESHGFAPVVGQALPDLIAGADRASPQKRHRLYARERRVWRRADGYVTLTAALADELRGWFGSRDRTVTIPDGVRLQNGRRFTPPRVRDAPLVGYAGHLYPWKGVDVLIDALGLLPAVRGLIVGGHAAEPDLARLRTCAEEHGLADRVTFTGLVDPPRVPALLSEADVLVLPNTANALSRSYTSPLKMFEYLAAGKPIVASDLPSLREVLRDGENALLVAPGSPDALAAGIRRALNDRALAERIARRAFDEAPAYAWDRRAERLEELLERAIR